MSTTIRRCPACGNLGQVCPLPKETVSKLLIERGLIPNRQGFPWTHAAYWCGKCNTPFIESWTLADVGERRELVGLPRDLVEIDEERGKR